MNIKNIFIYIILSLTLVLPNVPIKSFTIDSAKTLVIHNDFDIQS